MTILGSNRFFSDIVILSPVLSDLDCAEQEFRRVGGGTNFKKITKPISELLGTSKEQF